MITDLAQKEGEFKAKLSKFMSELSEIKKEINIKDRTIFELNNEIFSLKEEVEERQKDKELLRKDTVFLKNKLNEVKNQNTELSLKLNDQKHALEESQEKDAAYEKEIENLNTKIKNSNELRSSYDSLILSEKNKSNDLKELEKEVKRLSALNEELCKVKHLKDKYEIES